MPAKGLEIPAKLNPLSPEASAPDNRENPSELKAGKSNLEQVSEEKGAQAAERLSQEKQTQTNDRIWQAFERLSQEKGKEITPENLASLDADDLMDLELSDKGHGLLGALFLTKQGVPPLFFDDYGKFNTNAELEFLPGDALNVDFHNNARVENIIGAGDILPPQIRVIMVESKDGEKRMGVRRSSPRVGYYDEHGYMPIFSGDTIIIPDEAQIREYEGDKKMSISDDLRHVYFTSEEVKDQSRGEEVSKHTFIQQIRESKEKGEANFLQYLALEFSEFKDIMDEDIDFNARPSDDEFYNIAAAQGIKTEEFQMLKRLFDAISEKESNGKYDALGVQVFSSSYFGQRALGRYQIMPTNWKNWSNELKSLSGDLMPDTMNGLAIPSARNQDLVAFMKMAEYFNRFRPLSEDDRVQMVAAQWFGNPTKASTPSTLSTRNYYGDSPKHYAQTVLGFYDNFKLNA
ncbi:hypothetical protein HYV57_02255 [Candidatus Peregrinibacteria bacterium]|nr:hypothetical protein [Candidatus Peregrinibacteria bacterium]